MTLRLVCPNCHEVDRLSATETSKAELQTLEMDIECPACGVKTTYVSPRSIKQSMKKPANMSVLAGSRITNEGGVFSNE